MSHVILQNNKLTEDNNNGTVKNVQWHVARKTREDWESQLQSWQHNQYNCWVLKSRGETRKSAAVKLTTNDEENDQRASKWKRALSQPRTEWTPRRILFSCLTRLTLASPNLNWLNPNVTVGRFKEVEEQCGELGIAARDHFNYYRSTHSWLSSVRKRINLAVITSLKASFI